MQLSIIIPLFNEEESLLELHQWIQKVMITNKFSYEIIFIDDGSTDSSWQVIENISKQDKNVRGIRFLKNYGKSQALNAGFAEANGEVVVTMDADLQDSPEEIPELYRIRDGRKSVMIINSQKIFLQNSLIGLLEKYLDSPYTTLIVG